MSRGGERRGIGAAHIKEQETTTVIFGDAKTHIARPKTQQYVETSRSLDNHPPFPTLIEGELRTGRLLHCRPLPVQENLDTSLQESSTSIDARTKTGAFFASVAARQSLALAYENSLSNYSMLTLGRSRCP